MTQPTIDFELDMSGLPVSYSAIFQAVQGASNPRIEPNHPRAAYNAVRVGIPKGVSIIQVSTNYTGQYSIWHQETINGTPINTTQNMSGGGVFYVRALGDSSTLFITAPNMPNNTDTWGIVVTNFKPA